MDAMSDYVAPLDDIRFTIEDLLEAVVGAGPGSRYRAMGASVSSRRAKVGLNSDEERRGCPGSSLVGQS